MDRLALLRRAQDAGLRLQAAGTVLKITGPKEAEPLVRLLAEHKAQVLEALRLASGELQKMQEMQKIAPGASQGDLPQSAEEEAHKNRDLLENHDLLASNQLGTCAQVFAALRSKCPKLIEPDRWQQAIHDADSLLAKWGAEAHTLGWTARRAIRTARSTGTSGGHLQAIVAIR
jgi:hypothetical protein